jgi:hypothetical protein
MSLLGDWNGYETELQDEIKQYLQRKQANDPAVPPAVLALLKTGDLKTALKLADDAEAKNHIDDIRKAQGKTQKFFLMYANQYKLAKVSTKDIAALNGLSDALNMFNVYMTRTQVAVAKKADAMIEQAKAVATKAAKVKELNIKQALSPLRFMYDWKAAKQDFENETGVKKPSTKIMSEYRKSSGLASAMDDMDKACSKADPAAYRKAYQKFIEAHSAYESVLEKALVSDKAADAKYAQKVGGLKSVLKSIDTRAKEKITMLTKLGV